MQAEQSRGAIMQRGRRGRAVLRAVLAAGFVLAGAAPATGQASGVAGEVFAGGELESYLRLMQTTGESPLYPWAIRAFSPVEVDLLAPRDSTHPWAARYRFRAEAGRGGLHVHGARSTAVFNSAFPYGTNDGPVWAGRGVTTAFQAGFTARWQTLSLTVAPVLTWAQNASFELVPHESSDVQPYADPRHPELIDHPQRFGDGVVARLDPGQSTLRADLGPLALGFSSANQVWGPGGEYSLILGTNAPGYVHAFAGTSRPLGVGIGRAHGRFVWGRLEQSEFARTAPDSSARFTAGLVAVFTPRGVPGLELGAGRFFHVPWPSDGIRARHLLRPIEALAKSAFYGADSLEVPESAASNQLASLHARWVFPESGVELYGEFASEDHRHGLRDFLLEPDHDTSLMLALRKAWRREDGEIWLLRVETVNGEVTHLERGRRQEAPYIHYLSRQGHTHRGQILGAPAAYGGAGATVAVDRYHPGGRWSVSWKRTLRESRGDFLTTGEVVRPDVMQSLRAEALVFRGGWDVTAAVEGVYNFNRDFTSDVVNLNASLGLRAEL